MLAPPHAQPTPPPSLSPPPTTRKLEKGLITTAESNMIARTVAHFFAAEMSTATDSSATSRGVTSASQDRGKHPATAPPRPPPPSSSAAPSDGRVSAVCGGSNAGAAGAGDSAQRASDGVSKSITDAFAELDDGDDDNTSPVATTAEGHGSCTLLRGERDVNGGLSSSPTQPQGTAAAAHAKASTVGAAAEATTCVSSMGNVRQQFRVTVFGCVQQNGSPEALRLHDVLAMLYVCAQFL
jgi:hypothetical protein